ncbi:hypothetical protein SMSK23_1748 [Streptococcus oralis ATCC 35037]|nr:hypothetical protein SMSK23_1748 [Streptococcus oralis ATCC 35037]
MEINFRGLDVAYFDVLEMGEKKYVLDSNSTTPKSYYWGLSPETLEVDLIELDSQNKNFDKKLRWVLQECVWYLLVLVFFRIE